MAKEAPKPWCRNELAPVNDLVCEVIEIAGRISNVVDPYSRSPEAAIPEETQEWLQAQYEELSVHVHALGTGLGRFTGRNNGHHG